MRGEFHCTLDPKGRFLLPAEIKRGLGASAQKLVLKKGFEKFIYMYTLEQWLPVEEQVNKLAEFNTKSRLWRDEFYRGMKDVELDTTGRVLMPQTLANYGGLTKDIVLVGTGKFFKIWDKAVYEETMMPQDDFLKLTDDLFGNDLSTLNF